jgi:hypothetical protein
MQTACALFLLTTFYPLRVAWAANRHTTLRAALLWAAWAWLVWILVAAEQAAASGNVLLRYLGLSLTGCAGVAVLGARRPGVDAWSFVVLGLLAVFMLPTAPVLGGFGSLRLETPQIIFLGVVLAVTVLNYLPTRLGLGAFLLGAACGIELAALTVDVGWLAALAPWLVAASPWVGLFAIKWGLVPATEVDGVWRGFRDRYGLVWGQRQREQFNRAADNAGWTLRLGWGGVDRSGAAETPTPAETLDLLHSVLKRFGPPDSNDTRNQ